MGRSGGRRPDLRRIKTHRPYRPDEAARACGVSKQTVHRWIRKGLPAIKDKKPYLILGADLLEHLKNRYGPKIICADDEMYCFKCRAPRRADGNLVDFVPDREKTGNLMALCIVCGTLMNRRCSYNQLGAFGNCWQISIMQGPSHLIERANACLKDSL